MLVPSRNLVGIQVIGSKRSADDKERERERERERSVKERFAGLQALGKWDGNVDCIMCMSIVLCV